MAKKNEGVPADVQAAIAAHGFTKMNEWVREGYLRERAQDELEKAKKRAAAFE